MKEKEVKEIKEMAKKDDPKSDKSYWEMLITGIVRPPRAVYRDTQLGKFFIIQEQKTLHTTKFNLHAYKSRSYIKEKRLPWQFWDLRTQITGLFCIYMEILRRSSKPFLC